MKDTLSILIALVLALAADDRLEAASAKAHADQSAQSPHFISSPAELKARIPRQLHITKPDYVVFVPEVTDGGPSDTGNEHFLVFDGPDGSLMAVWTQSSVENSSPETLPDQHIVFSRSTDEGKTWVKPKVLAGPRRGGDGPMASWGYPLVSRKGRVYVLYSQNIGKYDTFMHHTGWLHGIYSDDNGAKWSKPQVVSVARSINDNPDPTIPPNMLCWQKPLRLGQDGKYIAGFTRWTSFAVRPPVPLTNLGSADSRVEFMRFENVDDNPEPRDLKISWFMSNEKALAVPLPKVPQNSVCQEPSIVKLPDGRLFCVMRTGAGSPFWSVSADVGESWTAPRRLLRKDGGEPLPHPVSPCPIYDVGGNEAGSGRYVLFIHNHDGRFTGYRPTPTVTGFNRRPVYLVSRRFQPGAEQPVWFDEPKLFMDHDNVSLGKPGTSGRFDLSVYSSFTVRNGKSVLWYPDRKFFLLGRIIGNDWFTSASAPNTQKIPWAANLKTPGSLRVAVEPPSDPRFAHLAWPKALRLSDGMIVLACLAGAYHGGGGCPAVSLSTDEGKTFSPPRILREFGPGKDYGNSGNLALGLAGDGAVVLLAMAHSGDTHNNIFGWRSTDRGHTWQPTDTSALGPDKTGSVTGTIIAVPGVGLMAAGHYRKGSTPYTQGIWISVSRDDGRSWGAAQRVSDIDAGEPVLVRAGGRLLIFIRGRGVNAKRQHLAVSDDYGATWRTSLIDITAARPKSSLTHPFAMMNPEKPDELLALTAERPLPGQFWLWRGDPQKLTWWRDHLLLELPKIAGDKHDDFGYPWLVPLGAGRALVFYYHGLGRGANSIWVAEISL